MLISSLPTVLIYRFGVRARMAVSLMFRLCWKLNVQRNHCLFIDQEVELCMVFFTRWKGCWSVAQTDNCEEYKNIIRCRKWRVVVFDSSLFVLRCSHKQARILELVCKHFEWQITRNEGKDLEKKNNNGDFINESWNFWHSLGDESVLDI